MAGLSAGLEIDIGTVVVCSEAISTGTILSGSSFDKSNIIIDCHYISRFFFRKVTEVKEAG